MPRSIKLSHKRRVIGQRLFAVAVSVGLHLAFLAPWAARKIDPGDQGGAVTVSLMAYSDMENPANEVPPAPAKAAVKAEPATVPQTETADAEKPPSPVEPLSGRDETVEAPALIEVSAAEIEASAQAAALANEMVLESVAAFMSTEMAALAGRPGQGCKIAEWLKQSLQESDEVEAALAQVPRQARSVANAVMLWDGAWVKPAPSAAIGMASVRYAIIAGVHAAPPKCLSEPVRGPLLIPIDGEGETLMLAIGSGVWRWADLLDETSPGSASTPLS